MSLLDRVVRLSDDTALPRIIQIELTSYCNAVCFFCAHTYSQRPQKHLDPKLYKKMIDEIRSFPVRISELYLTGLGEPMMHPNWKELYEYSNGLPGAFTTNCSILKESDIDFLLDLDFYEIAFSLDTLNDERHRKIRGFSVDRVAPKIAYFYKKALQRKLEGKRNPRLIVSTTLTYETLDDMSEIFEWLVPQMQEVPTALWHIKQIGFFPDIKALIQIIPPMTFTSKLNDVLPEHPQVKVIQGETSLRPYCVLWFDRVTILSDGSAVPCCHQAHDHNKIGNIADMSLIELFNSKGWKKSQEMFALKDAPGGWNEIPYCKDCR